MANKFLSRGDFVIPESVIDEHEWLTDSLIDSLGKTCTLVYLTKDVECPNCYLDRRTRRSSGIYKTGGPKEFANNTQCPWCFGEGHGEIETTESIKVRLYWDEKSWIGGIPFEEADGLVQMIGYMTDVTKIQRADHIRLADTNGSIHTWKAEKEGEFIPHGFRQDRYFIQFFRRTGGD